MSRNLFFKYICKHTAGNLIEKEILSQCFLWILRNFTEQLFCRKPFQIYFFIAWTVTFYSVPLDQKQPFTNVLLKRCSEIIFWIRRKHLWLSHFLYRVGGLQPATIYYKREPGTGVFQNFTKRLVLIGLVKINSKLNFWKTSLCSHQSITINFRETWTPWLD